MAKKEKIDYDDSIELFNFGVGVSKSFFIENNDEPLEDSNENVEEETNFSPQDLEAAQKKIIDSFCDILEDPVLFSKILKDPVNPSKNFAPYWYQEKIMRYFVRYKDDTDKIKKAALRFGRQSGKTVTIAALMVWAALRKPNQDVILVASRTIYLESVVRLFMNMISDTPIAAFVKSIRNGNPTFKITFLNGSKIEALVAGIDGSGVRSKRADFLFVDECFHKDTIVYLISGEKKKVSELRRGDRILTITTSKDYEESKQLIEKEIEEQLSFRSKNSDVQNLIEYDLKEFKTNNTLPKIRYTKVVDCKSTGFKELFMLETETGRKLTVTSDHPVVTKDPLDNAQLSVNRNGLLIQSKDAKYLATYLPARDTYTNLSNNTSSQYNRIAASVYGVLRAGKLPPDRNEFIYMLEGIGLKEPTPYLARKAPIYDTIKKKEIIRPVFDVFHPITSIPDFILNSRDTSREFISGYFSCFDDKIPHDDLIVEAISKWFPELTEMEDGFISPSNENVLNFFSDNIGYRYNKAAHKTMAILSLYYKSKLKDKISFEDWFSDRVRGDMVFEKIIRVVPIGVHETYGVKTENSYMIANGFVVHNCDYLHQDVWTALRPLIISAGDKANMLISSTPTPNKGEFWRAFNDPHSGYDLTMHIPSPSAPHWTEQIDNEFRSSMSPSEYRQEILAEFADDETALFKTEAIANSYLCFGYPSINKIFYSGLTIMGLDWNGDGSGGNAIVILRRVEKPISILFAVNKSMTEGGNAIAEETKLLKDGFVVIHKENIKSENVKGSIQKYTINRIAELCNIFKVNAIYGDKGYGHTYFEELHDLGRTINNPVLMGAWGCWAQKQLDVIDPVTGKKDRKMAKDLFIYILTKMVNEQKLYLSYYEDHLNKYNPNTKSKSLIGYELNNFRVLGFTPGGKPKYTQDHDHFIAAMGFAMIGYMIDFDPLFAIKTGVTFEYGDLDLRMLDRDRSRASVMLRQHYMNNGGDGELSEVYLKKQGSKHSKIVSNFLETFGSFNNHQTNSKTIPRRLDNIGQKSRQDNGRWSNNSRDIPPRPSWRNI